MFSGAEAPKTAQQVAMYGGVQDEQLDPCYQEACDNYTTLTGQPPAETMNVYEADPTPANLAIAQQQAEALPPVQVPGPQARSHALTPFVMTAPANRWLGRHRSPAAG